MKTKLKYLCYFYPKNPNFLPKGADISKIKGVVVLLGIFFQTKYVCIYIAN